MIQKLSLLNIVIASILAFFVFLGVAAFTYGEISFNENTQSNSYQVFQLLSATTTTATSTNLGGGGGYVKIAGAKKVELIFSRGGRSHANTGSSAFKVQVSNDAGVTWNDFPKLVLGTSTAQVTQSPINLSGTSTVLTSLDLRTDTFYGLRCVVNQTTDGEQTCQAAVEF